MALIDSFSTSRVAYPPRLRRASLLQPICVGGTGPPRLAESVGGLAPQNFLGWLV